MAKGGRLLEKIAALDNEGSFIFHLLGNVSPELKIPGVPHGPYRRENLERLVAEIAPHLGLIPSIWAETYSHVLTEMWALGLPVVGSSLGAVGQRIIANGGGLVFDPNLPSEAFAQIRELVSNRALYSDIRNKVELIESVSIAEMVAQYEAVYEASIARRRTFGPL